MVPPHCHATNDAVGNNNMITKMMHMFFACVWVRACIYMCVCVCVLFCSEVIQDAAVLSFQSELAGSPLSPSTGN